MSAMSEILLSPNEARVIAVLVEKSITTPQYYPMTVNAIMLAANQKSSRSPVMQLSEGDVGNALNQLEEHRLVGRDSFSGRAQKWRHQFLHQMLLKPATQAVLVTLMLRGPQTVAELRANAGSLNGPGDDEGVLASLDDLADRAQPLVVQLPRAPGQSAVRYAHLLCGADAVPAAPEGGAAPATERRGDAQRLAALEGRIAMLEARLASLEQVLGVQSEARAELY
ncbi:MAG: YceH family protein [Solimonas sp.]